MNHTEQRMKLRAVLEGPRCVSPASVFDPMSARIAEAVGYEIGQVGGSILSHAVLAAPELPLLTLTEVAGQIRRIMRVSKLSLIVDADNGYGNALNTMRTVQELEHAGVSALTIEDTVFPVPFGQEEGKESLTSIEEGVAKLRAAVAARSDPSLVIVARTSALRIEGTEGTVARARAYAATGVDAFQFVAVRNLEQMEALYAACKLPIILREPAGPAPVKREELESRGARILMHGHQPIAAAAKAMHEVYAHLFGGGATADLKSKIASPPEMNRLVDADRYIEWQREYLH